MKHYKMTARLLSPLLIQENRQSNAPKGLSYLPGSTLRGALAGKYLREGGSASDESFQNIFLKTAVCFPDLFPISAENRSSRPMPLTANSCKREPGFQSENGHGVDDGLAALYAAGLERQPLTRAFECKQCGQDMKPLKDKFWDTGPEGERMAGTVPILHRHTGIDRVTNTVAQSIFYTTPGISEWRKTENGDYDHQYFAGNLWLDEDQFAELSEWIDDTVFVGADRTRGMGEIKLKLEEADPPAFDIKSWNDRFRKKVAKWTTRSISGGWFFSIGLISHTIPVDRFLRPEFDLPISFADVTPELRVIQSHTIRGWQAAWSLAKPDDTAVRMGSVYLYRYNGTDWESVSKYLNQLMKNGIGLRRSEGFGRISVCDPIHTQEVI